MRAYSVADINHGELLSGRDRSAAGGCLDRGDLTLASTRAVIATMLGYTH